MKLEIEIDLNDKGKAAAFILFLQACNGVIVTETSVGVSKEVMANAISETPSKTTRTKKAVEKPAVEETKTEEVEETKEVETVEGEKITIEQIREAFATKVNNGDNRLILKTELSRLGAENLSKLDPSKYAEFLKFIENVQ
jgi:hypothetical protein